MRVVPPAAAKRAQDRDKLKELDKMRIQLEQLQEFKARMLEQQAQLQKELKKAKEERQEAVEERQRIQEETSDVQETLEMAALDKEMADEKAETLQLELDQANERIEELRLDLQILQEEVQQKGDSGEATATSFQVKQLAQQNERLKETLIRSAGRRVSKGYHRGWGLRGFSDDDMAVGWR